MQPESTDAVFKVLAPDNLIYGPIDLATLVQWVRERRVQRESWIHWETEKDWVAAGSISALQAEFDALPVISEEPAPAESALPLVKADELRSFERFAAYPNEDLAVLLTYCEFITARKEDVIIRNGDLSDSMYLVLSGKVRARLLAGGRETQLGTMGPGELFGEIAMLSQTARSADVLANVPSRLLRLTSKSFQELMANYSELAVRMLFNISRQLATRMSQRNQDLQKDLASSYVWR